MQVIGEASVGYTAHTGLSKPSSYQRLSLEFEIILGPCYYPFPVRLPYTYSTHKTCVCLFRFRTIPVLYNRYTCTPERSRVWYFCSGYQIEAVNMWTTLLRPWKRIKYIMFTLYTGTTPVSSYMYEIRDIRAKYADLIANVVCNWTRPSDL